ncbi:hypothetical protein VYP57_11345 [Streptococcus agalactiae]|uniref:hypothetical protein n=1 Tax=Streptococcus agalactiae TaxID=1311 RepID=UPI0039C72472
MTQMELIETFKANDIQMTLDQLRVYEMHGIGLTVNIPFWKSVAELFDCDVAYLLNLRLTRKEQELIFENEFLRDENRRLTNDLNKTITDLETFLYGRKN